MPDSHSRCLNLPQTSLSGVSSDNSTSREDLQASMGSLKENPELRPTIYRPLQSYNCMATPIFNWGTFASAKIAVKLGTAFPWNTPMGKELFPDAGLCGLVVDDWVGPPTPTLLPLAQSWDLLAWREHQLCLSCFFKNLTRNRNCRHKLLVLNGVWGCGRMGEIIILS